MIGLMIIGALLVYLLFSLLLAWLGARIARWRGIAGWKVGVPVFVAMLLVVFWDWLPMEVMFKHHCGKYAGFTQYKTLDEWKAENPGMAETLRPSNDLKSTREGNLERYVLNQRFAWEITYTPLWFNMLKREEHIVDVRTGEMLARYVDFSTDIPPIALGVKHPEAYKIWMMKGSCEEGDSLRTKPIRFKFSKFMYLVQHQKEFEK